MEFGYSPSTGKYFTKGPDGKPAPVEIDKVPVDVRNRITPGPAAPRPAEAAADRPDEFGRFKEKAQTAVEAVGGDRGVSPLITAPLGVVADMLPSDRASAAIDASALIPGGEGLSGAARIGLNVLKPALAGGLAGATEGKGMEGAGQGAIAGGLAEIPASTLGTATAAKRIAAEDNKSLGKVVGDILKVPFKKMLGDTPSLPMWMRTATKEPVSQRFESEMGALSKQVGDNPIINRPLTDAEIGSIAADSKFDSANLRSQLKTTTVPMTFEEARDQLKTLGARAFKANGGLRDGERAQQALEDWVGLHKQVVSGLEKANPEWAEKYGQINGDYEKWKTLSRLFSDEDLLTKRGDFNMGRMQQMLRDEGGLQKLQSALTPDEYKQFVDTVSRGQGLDKGVDIPGFMRRGGDSMRVQEHGGKPSIFSRIPIPTRERPMSSSFIGNTGAGGDTTQRAGTLAFSQLMDLFKQSQNQGTSK